MKYRYVLCIPVFLSMTACESSMNWNFNDSLKNRSDTNYDLDFKVENIGNTKEENKEPKKIKEEYKKQEDEKFKVKMNKLTRSKEKYSWEEEGKNIIYEIDKEIEEIDEEIKQLNEIKGKI